MNDNDAEGIRSEDKNISPGVALVTGGSRGIGAATCRGLARIGYAVGINYRSNRSAAEDLAMEIKSEGGQALPLYGDVSLEQDVLDMFNQATENLGPLTALVNNAAILERQMPVREMTPDRIDRTFATNVRGSILCAREAVRHMAKSSGGNGGTIVNVSSAAARLGSANEYVDYAASKGAIDTFTIGLSKEVAGDGVRVNGVRPGFIKTEMHASGGEPDRINRVRGSIPLGRGGEAEEVANAIVWLISAQSSYCTGAILDISGGR